MATFSQDIIDGINLALNEATILGVEFQKEKEIVVVTFSPVALDINGQVPTDNRVQFVFKPIGKFIASYRLGRWDDKSAQVVKFEPEQILEKVEEFKHVSIYGWEFINCNDENHWLDRLSFDFNSENQHGRQNTIDLFQDGGNKHIDMKIWFDDFEIVNPKYEKIELQTFIDNGKRGWDGIYYGNASDKFGIYPAK
ncbi:MAG: hypothetical protein J0L54_08185 [Chitinophagales bacterium]|nr:hypothetical protein [Chitinophagales bacterium]